MKKSLNMKKATSGLGAFIILLTITACGGGGGSFGIPTGVSATNGTLIDRVQVTWNRVSGADRYYITRSTTDIVDGPYTSVGYITTETYNDYNVSKDIIYFYKVEAWSAENGYSGTSDGVTGSLQNPANLGIPASFDASDGVSAAADRINLSWNSVTDATKYYIYRSDSSGGTFSFLGQTTGLTYSDMNVSPGDQFYYKVKAWSPDGYSLYSTEDMGDVTSSLAEPTGLAASSGTHLLQVELSWNTVAGAVSYDIYRSLSPTGTFSSIATAVAGLAYDDTSAEPGTTYYYKARSYDGSEYSALNSTAAAGYRSAPLDVPEDFSASDGTADDRVTLSWTDVGGGATYDLQRSSTGTTGTFSDIQSNYSGTSYDDTSVTAGTTYWYRICSYDSGTGSRSSYSSADTGYGFDTAATLAAPSGVQAADGLYRKIRITWNSVPYADSYSVYSSADSYVTAIQTGITGTTFEATGLTDGQTVSYRVTAVSSVLPESSQSSTVSATTQSAAITAPTAGSLTATGNSDNITLGWGAVTGATRYYIYRSPGTGGPYELIAVATGTSHVDYSLPAGDTGTYFYVIRSYNSTGLSAESNELSAGKTSLSALADVAATDGTSADSVTVSWTDDGSAEDYHIYRSADGGTTWNEIGINTGSPFTDSTPVSGFTYQYRVLTWSSAYGYSASSNIDTGNSAALLATPSIDSVTTGTSDTTVTINWPGGTVGGATDYLVYRGTSATDLTTYVQIASTSGTTDDDTTSDALPPTHGTRYYYRIKAYDSTLGRYSTESAAVEGYLKLSTPGVTSITAGTNATTVTVQWGDITGETSYTVQRSTDASSWSDLATGVAADSTSYIDNSAVEGTGYYYRIIGVDTDPAVSSDPSAASSEGYLTLDTVTISGQTQGTDTSDITITWNAVDGETGFNILRSTDNSTFTAIASGEAANSTSYVDSTGSEGQGYYYRVQAVYGDVDTVTSTESPSSSEAYLTIDTPAAPTASTNVTGQIDISWSDVDGETGYRITRDITTGGAFATTVATVTAGTISYSDTTGTEGEGYFYRVTAIYGNIDSTPETTSLSSNEGYKKLATPTGFSATLQAGPQAYLSWTTVSGAAGYKIYRSTTSGSGPYTEFTSGTNSYTDTTVSAATTYYYTVSATDIDPAQEGDTSTEDSVIVP